VDGEGRISAAESGHKVVLKCANSAFRGVASVSVGWDELVFNLVASHIILE
jgi:hypothetical protein